MGVFVHEQHLEVYFSLSVEQELQSSKEPAHLRRAAVLVRT